MMRVIIDTNVFASGVFWKGPPHKILEAWKNRHFALVISIEIFEEYQRILKELNSKYPFLDVSNIIDIVSFHSEMVTASSFPRAICTDPDDDKFLAAALAGRVDHIVTGDKALLKLNGFNGVHILKPASFLNHLSGK